MVQGEQNHLKCLISTVRKNCADLRFSYVNLDVVHESQRLKALIADFKGLRA